MIYRLCFSETKDFNEFVSVFELTGYRLRKLYKENETSAPQVLRFAGHEMNHRTLILTNSDEHEFF